MVFPVICIVGGFLLGKLADDTKSVLPVVSMHSLIILTTNSGQLNMQKIIGIALTIVGWIIIEKIWRKRTLPEKVRRH